MDSSTISGLKQAFYKYSRQIGKFHKQDALTLLTQLGLTAEATELVKAVVLEAFEKDAFADYLRTEAISIRLELILAREGVRV